MYQRNFSTAYRYTRASSIKRYCLVIPTVSRRCRDLLFKRSYEKVYS